MYITENEFFTLVHFQLGLITIFSGVYGVLADLPAVPDGRQEFVHQNHAARKPACRRQG